MGTDVAARALFLYMDDFVSLSNRLLNRCPAVGILLAGQLVNDAWQTLQAMQEWSFRRRGNTFAPPTIYNAGYASSNVAGGQPTLISGIGTAWTSSMVGRQIRVGGLLYPFYTIIGYQSPTALIMDQPWAGPDVSGQAYDILQSYYPAPADFGYWYAVVSIKDGYRLWTNITESEIDMLDPQRSNYGQTYAVAFRDYSPQYGGVIGPVIPVTSITDPAPFSTTTTGFTYPANATYIIQVVTGGSVPSAASFQWMRSGQTAWSGPTPMSQYPQNLSDGVQVYWPTGVNFIPGDIYIINCISQVSQSTPRYELWPAPTFSGYLYPYQYIAKEYAITEENPTLPPFVANRGEVLLEMALQKCAEFPGADSDHLNIYHDLRQAVYHGNKVKEMLIDLERNDQEVGVTNIDFQQYPFYPSPWMDGGYQQHHAPFLNG